jgi:hypothetical protein
MTAPRIARSTPCHQRTSCQCCTGRPTRGKITPGARGRAPGSPKFCTNAFSGDGTPDPRGSSATRPAGRTRSYQRGDRARCWSRPRPPVHSRRCAGSACASDSGSRATPAAGRLRRRPSALPCGAAEAKREQGTVCPGAGRPVVPRRLAVAGRPVVAEQPAVAVAVPAARAAARVLGARVAGPARRSTFPRARQARARDPVCCAGSCP